MFCLMKDPPPDKAKGKYGETLIPLACDTVEVDTEHDQPPLIKGKIIEIFAAGGIVQMEPDCLDPGSENMTSYQKKFFWKQIKSLRFRATLACQSSSAPGLRGRPSTPDQVADCAFDYYLTLRPLSPPSKAFLPPG